MIVKTVLNWLIPIAILLWVIYLFLKKFGLTPSEDDPEIESEVKSIIIAKSKLREANAFNPQYWHKAGSIDRLLTRPVARGYANDIYEDLKGLDVFNRAYPRFISLMKKLTNQLQVSQISWEFSVMFNVDLVDWIEDDFDGSEINNILNVVTNLSEK